jgi:hypothetical protein
MRFDEIKQRLDPKCWTGKKIGNPKTKMKGGVRVNNCVPAESVAEGLPDVVKNIKHKVVGDPKDGPRKTMGLDASLEKHADDKMKELGHKFRPKKQQGVAEGPNSGYTYKDTDEGTYLTNTMGETLFIPDVSLQDQGFKPGDRRLPEVWQMNLEMADETGAYIVDDEQGVAEGNFTKTPSGDYRNMHTGRTSSTAPTQKKKRGEKTWAKWDAIEKAKKANGQGVAEDYNPEYDDEAGMAQGSLHTLQNAVAGLQDVIDSGDNLPEWCQEKISLAEDYLVTVWDYIQSEKAQGIDPEISEEFDMIERIIESIAAHNGVDSDAVWTDLESLTEDELYAFAVTSQLNEDWSKVNKRDKTDGMSQKAVNAYRRENPGSKLKTAVTTKPSKLKKGSKASKRRKSYCSRSKGQMNMHNISCAKTPDKAICKARRRWNC